MPDFDTLFAKYSNALGVSDQKKAVVSDTSEAKKTGLGASLTPTDIYKIGAGISTGKGLASASTVETDVRTLTPSQLSAKYGSDVAMDLNAAAVQGMGQFRRDYSANRTDVETLFDSAGSAGLGFVNGLAGIGALAVGGAEKIGLAPDGSGSFVADKIGDANTWAQSKQSTALNDRRQAAAATQGLDERDSEAQFEKDKAGGSNFLAGLRRIGRDSLSGVTNTLSDPMMVTDGVSAGAGSLYSGGAIGKSLNVVGDIAAARTAVGATGPSKAGFMISKASDKGAMPVAIGSLEAGGAYQQTADRALEMGASPEEANNAGLMAAGIQAPIGVATGALVSKFEAAPTKVGSLGSMASNMLRETVEEGVQSGSGQMAGNIGLRTYVDPTQDLSDGVGGQIGEGALFGLGTAGALQGPGAVVEGVTNVATKGAQLAVDGAKALMERGDRILSGIQSEQAQKATTAQNEAAATAADLNQELQGVVQAKGGEQAPQMAEYLTRLFDNVKFDPAEAGNEAPVVQEAVQGAQDRFAALRQVSDKILDPKTSEADRIKAAAYILSQFQQYNSVLEDDLRDAVQQISDEDPLLEKLAGFVSTTNALKEHPRIVAALKAANEAMSSGSIQDQFSEKAFSTPEGQQSAQQAANAVIELATIDPEQANPEVLDVIRSQSVAGRLNLTLDQKGILETASALIRATKEMLEQKKTLGLSYVDHVTQEVQTRDEAGASELVKKSAKEHAKSVLTALRVDDRELARERLVDFMLFAQHMQNKVDALNLSVVSGTNEPYSALSSKRDAGQPVWFKASKGLGLKLYDQASVKFAQQIALDARAVADLANGMAAAFPDLGLQSVSPVLLGVDPKLEKKATEIVKEYEAAKKASSTKEVNTDKVAEPDKSKVEQPTSVATQDALVETKAATELDPQQQPLPFDKPVEPLKEAEQPVLPLAQDTKDADPVADVTETEAPVVAQENTPEQPEVIEPFANLIGSKDGKNWFKKAFRFPEKARSRLAGLGDQVLATVSKSLSSVETFQEAIGSVPSHKLTDDVIKAYQGYLSTVPEIQEAMEKRLADFLSKNNIDGAKAENPAQQWVKGKALNVVQDMDGKRSYDPGLLQGSILAGLQWLLNTENRPSRELDEEAVAAILGVAPTELEEGAVEFFNDGVWLTDAKRSIAGSIPRFWGVEADRSAPMGYTMGIPEAMAAEVLKGMEDAGLIQLIQEKYGEGDKSRTINRVRILQDESFQDAIKTMAAVPSAIEQVALTEPEEARFIGAPPTGVPEFQMRNRLVKNTEQQRQAIKAEQDTPHFINPQMVSFLETLGEDLVLKLFGAGEIDENAFNKNDALSLKGQNASIRGAYKALIGMLSELRNKSEVAGIDPSEMPIHYEYNVSRVGRMHMLGLHNPQSSKLMREAILPTRVTIDLENKQNKDKFMLAVAQAWGVKVHKQSREKSVQDVQSLAVGSFRAALDAINSHLSGATAPDQLVEELKKSFGDKLSVAAVHAAMEYVRFQQSNDRSAFTTDLYVEADGVTDGPVNALVHISTGAFTAKWVQLVAKGGLFLGSKGMTVNKFVSQGEPGAENQRDLYQTTTDAFSVIMGRYRQELSADPKLSALSNDLLLVMDGLLGSDLSFDGENLTIERGIAKNPLTVTIYGSGAVGIADKVTGAMTAAFYKELSKATQGLPNRAVELEELMEILTTRSVFQGKDGLYTKDLSRETETPRNSTPQGYTLTPSQMKNLRQNVLHLFVTPLREAIESTIEDTKAGRTSLQEAIQVQSIFLEHAFKQMVEAKLDEKEKSDPAFKRSDFLSQNEMEAIYDELKAMSPLVQTGTQTFFVAGSETADVNSSEFARSLEGDLSTPSYVYGPKDAGVAGIPYLVIGPGDGQMMQNISTMPGAPKGTLKVFDGVHLKLDTLDEDALKVNQAVYDAWQNNPLSAVNDSFQTFLEGVSFDTMRTEQIDALNKALFSPKEREAATEHDIKARVLEIGAELKRLSADAQARHDALSKVAMSVDHMASAEASFEALGESLEGMTDEQIAHRLNQLKTEPVLQKEATPSPDLQNQETIPEDTSPATLSDPAVEVLDKLALLRQTNKLDAPAELKNLLKEALRALPAGWEIVRGKADQTSAYAISKGEVPHTGRRGEVIKGYTSLSQKRIYLNTDEAETLLHELLHASVTEKILAHYEGKTTSEVTEAVTQLETLMAEWMSKADDLSGLTPEQRRAYKDAFNQVKAEQHNADRIPAQNKAAALDEFLAWNLSNQDLIKIAQQTKVDNPVARVIKRVLISLKNLIWGRKMSPMVRSDMYSALRFNASVLINSNLTYQARAMKLVRAQSASYGNSERLVELHKKLAHKIFNALEEMDQVERLVAEPRLTALVDKVSADFMSNGFGMTPQELYAFTALMTVFASQAKLDQAALTRVQELYTHVNKTLKVEDFMADPKSQDPAVRYAAQQKFSVLKGIDYASGRSIVGMDDQGRSTLMPAFLALAMVNDEFREVLSNVTLPKGERQTNDTLDNILTNAGNNVMDTLSRALSGEGRNRANVREAIDALTDRLVQNVEGQESAFSQLVSPLSNAINGLNEKTVEVMQTTSKKAIDKATEIQGQTNNKAVKGLLEVGKGIAAVVNEQEARLLAEGWIATANRLKIFEPAHDFLNDLIGRTDSNASIFDMIKRVRSEVQQMRQQFREHLPGLIAQRFTKDLSKEEWGGLFKGLAKTDLAALRQTFTVEQILEMLTDQARQTSEIRKLEDLIQIEAGASNWKLIKLKSEQLANFMNVGTPGSHLLRNAEAISKLFGVRGAMPYTPSKALIGRVDQLVTLYALAALDQSTKDTLVSLAQEEAQGLSFTLSYLVGQRVAEQGKVATDKAKANHYKGYIPSLAQEGAQLVVAKNSEEGRLRLLGYRRVGDYKASSSEFGAEGRGYFFAPISSRALFNQGIMQNVRQTASGVDPVTGHTHDGLMTAGRITDPRAVLKISRRLATETGESLMPIFDADGEIIAYERSVDPNQEQRLNRDQHLARMIGVWRGRQAEESLAGKFNKLLVENLHHIWTRDRQDGREDEFVDLLDPAYQAQDLVVKDAVSLFTPEALEHIRQTFGGDGFMVRRDMINDAIGFRSASLGDVWTGTTRLPPNAADVAKRMAVGVFGADAYRHLVTAEKLTQNLVSEARQLIVVKSVVVPISNFIANIYQLMSRGVSPVRILKDIPKKLAETNAYVERRQRQIELEALLRAAEGNVIEIRKINAELQSILDANKRMSIWPLIEAGEFASISDAGSLEKEDTTLFEGKLTQFIEQKVNQLPPKIRTVARYGLITQDTALFQGMRKAMEYGDFLAKAITYDHLTQEKKQGSNEALAKVTEEFVNYDRLSGRFRTYAENIGLLWFWNFKVRIAKIAVATIRENPIHALMTSLVPTPEFVGSIGTPLSDNLFAMSAQGDLGWSMGPGMGMRSYEMNPWVSLFK